ncbi:hypothetical protein SKAU_G00416760 [Synaphobranchus kaupii]|uniref:UPAR/Ly6 domain-containing protein n=1 Tax=Synaphobranchus kaupii TaxID=118154 RepID=A0A9Q1E5U4_SYNKA|nr:hypothetical protein SKAU_G00416760 [Synaphobranchus kaupii]
MELLVTLVLACALFSKVYPLDCHECIPTGPGPCSQTINTCEASQTKCASATAEISAGTTQTEAGMKSCAAPTDCVTGSINYGLSRTSVNIKCCDSSLCNDELPPVLPGTSPNGKKCFTCVDNNCTHTLECIGPEDRCIKSSMTIEGQKATLKGCASKTACSGSLNSQLGAVGMDMSCCEEDMCNSALRIRQSILFLLLVPLASFILFN